MTDIKNYYTIADARKETELITRMNEISIESIAFNFTFFNITTPQQVILMTKEGHGESVDGLPHKRVRRSLYFESQLFPEKIVEHDDMDSVFDVRNHHYDKNTPPNLLDGTLNGFYAYLYNCSKKRYNYKF